MTNLNHLRTELRFPSGQLVQTTAATRKLVPEDVLIALGRHLRCDWGDVCPEDWQENDESLSEGFRLFSVYHDRNGVKFWIITEAGRYVAEQFTVDLVLAKKGFSVLDRANLNVILKEHKLTATGLVNPENAKKLGEFAGVDALILGTVVQKVTTVGITAKIIATDTAEIVGAAKGEFKLPEETAGQSPAQPAGSRLNSKSETAVIKKTLGNLQVELPPLQIVNGRGYILTMTFSNPSQKSVWASLKTFGPGTMPAVITDPNQTEFQTFYADVTGIQTSPHDNEKFFKATEIAPGESITATVKFASNSGPATAGLCRLQMEILVGNEFRNGVGTAKSHNLVTQIEAK